MVPDTIRPDTESAAERRLFDSLRDRTDDAYIAYHHVAWLVPGERAPRQGEADFVIAHPKLGVAILEVKGGAIRFDAASGKWHSGPHELKTDPFDQARRSSFVLVDSLARVTGLSRAQVRVGYGVAFPDVHLSQVDLRLDMPREILLSGDDLAEPAAAVRRLLEYWRGKDPGARIDLTALDRILGKSFELPAPLGIRFGQQEADLMRLTEQQYDVLDTLAHQTRAAIGGCAGSGKTFLAAEKARRLAGQGFRVLLLCYNLLLARHLREGLADVKGIDVFAFDELCESVVRESGGKLPDRRHEGTYWPALRRAFADAAVELGGRYDALIVDEAQDMQPDWWDPLQLLLKDPDKSPLYLFFDDNQRIFPTRDDLPVPKEPVQLAVNCRNTQRIHRLVNAYYEGGTIKARGPDGVAVEQQTYGTKKELVLLLDASIRRWIKDAQLDPSDIALLTPHGQDSSALWWQDTLGGVKLTDDPWQAGAILRSSVYRFKGLERRVVGVVELDGAQDKELYIAFSRASLFLSVFYPESEAKRIGGHVSRVARAVRGAVA